MSYFGRRSGGGGSGDMLKSVYDVDDNGIVDNASLLGGDSKAVIQSHAPAAHNTNVEDVLPFPASGLWLKPDTAPYLATTLTPRDIFLPGPIKYFGDNVFWSTHFAYGLDLLSQRTVSHLYALTHSGATSEAWYTSAYDSFKVLGSNNNSSWTLLQQFDAPPLKHYCINKHIITFQLSAPQTYRYFKIVCIDTYCTYAGPATAYFCGIAVSFS